MPFRLSRHRSSTGLTGVGDDGLAASENVREIAAGDPFVELGLAAKAFGSGKVYIDQPNILHDVGKSRASQRF